MLGVRTYERTYVDSCRAKIAADVSAFEAISPGVAKIAATASFEHVYFNNLVIVLDALFMHRLRTVEGKDGNPLNEVRVICSSIMEHGGKLTPDPAIKLSSSTSILKLQPGDAIALNQTQFNVLANAFFAEIERKFV